MDATIIWKTTQDTIIDQERHPDSPREIYVRLLASMISGFSLERVEKRLTKFLPMHGYEAFDHISHENAYRFHVRRNNVPGWDGIAFTLKDGVVMNVTMF